MEWDRESAGYSLPVACGKGPCIPSLVGVHEYRGQLCYESGSVCATRETLWECMMTRNDVFLCVAACTTCWMDE
jgi:hypothetical protein